MSVMALSYIAQALVVTIVGLNMGFRWCVGVSYMRGMGREGATGTEKCEVNLGTDNNSTVGKTTFTFGRSCSWRRRKAPLCQSFPVFPAIRHCAPKKAENKKKKRLSITLSVTIQNMPTKRYSKSSGMDKCRWGTSRPNI
jgi:hypothetical protein